MKLDKNKNKKKILIIIGVILLLFICILLFFLLKGKSSKEEIKPYVIEKGIEILPANGEYSVPVEPYFKDGNSKVIDVDGITMNKTKATYRFYDYSVSEPDQDNFVTHKFKVECKTPIEYIEQNNKKYPTHKYTSLFSQPSIFDYYTGTIFREKHVSTNNTVNYYDIKPTDEDMAFTEVTWDGKTYKIGVMVEASMKWDGIKKTNNGNGTSTVRDTATTSVVITMYAPKDYDGLMTFFDKKGTTKQDFLNQLDYSNKYNELVKEAEKTGEKSDELKDIEERSNKNFKLLEARTKDSKELKNDTFFVIRVSEIEKEK